MGGNVIPNEIETGAGAAPGVLLSLTPQDITVDETKNLRRFAPEAKPVEELAQDIVKHGQLQPVIVTKSDNGAPYRLIAGYRRVRALNLLIGQGHDIPIKAVLMDIEDGKKGSLVNLSENVRRKELTYMDLAVAVGALQKEGMSGKEIAQELQKSPSFVSQIAKFTALRPNIQRGIHSGDIPLAVARELAGMDEEEQDKYLAAAAEAKTAGGSQREAGSAVTNKKKSKRGRKAKGDEKKSGGISAKGALLLLEQQTAAVKNEEKTTKAQDKAVEVYGLFTKFLNGKLGVKALNNKLVELL